MSDLSEIGRVSIGVSEFGLSEGQSKRLRGESADEVRADARTMRSELGLDDEGDDDRHEQADRGATSMVASRVTKPRR